MYPFHTSKRTAVKIKT